jgi:hypothetical protein
MNRVVIHLVHRNADDRWYLESEGKDLFSYATKSEAVEAGKKRGNALASDGRDAQLVVHREDGSIETEYTYGHDPRRTPG